MPLRAGLRSAAVLALLSLACACGGGGGGGSTTPPPPPPPTADWYVSETTGSDGAAGSAAEPFRTITHACTQATSGQTIQVLPGSYTTAIGEVFPIVIPAGVIVLGDEANKGGGATPTNIAGSGLAPAPNAVPTHFAAVVPGQGSTLAGFGVVCDATGPNEEQAVYLQAAGVTVRNNQIAASVAGIVCRAGFGNHVIVGNVLQSNAYGLLFTENSGIGSRVENNLIALNNTGVEYDSAGGDMGGGAAGSSGGNLLFCNVQNDLVTNVMITIDAANNRWDHAPPSGNDISNSGGATIITTGATAVANPCP